MSHEPGFLSVEQEEANADVFNWGSDECDCDMDDEDCQICPDCGEELTEEDIAMAKTRKCNCDSCHGVCQACAREAHGDDDE